MPSSALLEDGLINAALKFIARSMHAVDPRFAIGL